VTGSARPPWWLIVLGGVLLIGLIGLVTSSLRRPTPPTYPITRRPPIEAGDSLLSGRVTLDARSADRWSFFDFSRDAPVEEPDPLEWDVAVRRTSWIVNGGEGFPGRGGAQASDTGYDDLRIALGGAYAGTIVSGGDSAAAAFDGWYRYDFLSHLLWPRPISFVIRTADGRYAKLEIESYYCPGPEPGCVSFRYAYQGDGSGALASRADSLR
jgi:hypothetical protein